MADYASEAGHWYHYPCGTPFYTMIGKNGKQRNVTKRDARLVNAVPAVSSVTRLNPAQQLEKWKRDQVIFLTAENPRGELEGIQAYADRIQNLLMEQGRAIMDLGSEIHGAIEKAMTDTVWIPRPEAHAAIQTLGEWCGHGGWHCEKSFAHPLGYGGKCDAHKPGFLVDFKTKDFGEEWVPAIYDSHHMQLAAYREGFRLGKAKCAIIYVSTTSPGLARLVEAPESSLAHGWELFKALLKVWQVQNKYVPKLEEGTEDGKRERTLSVI